MSNNDEKLMELKRLVISNEYGDTELLWDAIEIISEILTDESRPVKKE